MGDLSRRAGDALRRLRWQGKIETSDLRGMLWIADNWLDVHYSNEDPRPDTDDPLTVFGLLLLAREAWGEPNMSVQYAVGEWWCGSAFLTDRGQGPTEAEAVVAALEAAVEAARG